MRVMFFGLPDDRNLHNGSSVGDTSELLNVLESLRSRDPFICELRGENGFTITIGIGELGCAQYARTDGSGPYLVAVSPEESEGQTDIEFVWGGTATPISPRHCLRFDLVKKVAMEFQKTGLRSPAVSWEEV